jgi:hypothetical protein
MIDPLVEQLRNATRGSLRIGDKTDTGRPTKLDTIRATSADPDVIDQLADIYGGTPEPSDLDTEPFQVITGVSKLDVLVPPQDFDPYLEVYSKGGLQKRCSGSTEFSSDWPPKKLGACPNENASHRDCSFGCKPGIRFAVFLADTSIAGTFTVRSTGWGTYHSVQWYFNLARPLHSPDDPDAQPVTTPGILELRQEKRRADGKTTRFPVIYLHADMQGVTWKQLRQEQPLHPSGRPVLSDDRPALPEDIEAEAVPNPAEVPERAPDARAENGADTASFSSASPKATRESAPATEPTPEPRDYEKHASGEGSGGGLIEVAQARADLIKHLTDPPNETETMLTIEAKLRNAFALANRARLARWTHVPGRPDALHIALSKVGAAHVGDLKKAQLLGFTKAAFDALDELVRTV